MSAAWRLAARATGVGVAVAVMLAAAACGQEDEAAAPGDASDEKAITVYSGRNENLIGPLIERFEQETGITVEVRYGNTAQMAAQLLEEGERTPADVFLAQDAGALGAVAKAGLFAPLPEEVRQQVPPAYQASGGEWVGVTGRSRVLVYNSEAVAEDELPASVFELTEPQWKGRVGLAPTNASFQAFITAMRVTHGDDVAAQWLEGMAANDPQIRENNTQILTDVEEGRLDVGLINHYYLHERASEAGVPVEELTARNYRFPDGDIGAMVNVSGVGVLENAADDPHALAFVEYLLSEAGQTYFTEETSEYPVVAGVAPPAGLPPLTELAIPDVNLNDLDTLEETILMITEAGLA